MLSGLLRRRLANRHALSRDLRLVTGRAGVRHHRIYLRMRSVWARNHDIAKTWIIAHEFVQNAAQLAWHANAKLEPELCMRMFTQVAFNSVAYLMHEERQLLWSELRILKLTPINVYNLHEVSVGQYSSDR